MLAIPLQLWQARHSEMALVPLMQRFVMIGLKGQLHSPGGVLFGTTHVGSFENQETR